MVTERERKRRKTPRRLRFTREGQVLVVIAFAVGFAAINTGHNLLYFGWGLVLAAIVTSGVLSEVTLRSLRARPRRPDELRAHALSPLPLVVENPRRRLPALAVELELSLRRVNAGAAGAAPDEPLVAAPYLLRLGPQQEELLLVSWVPRARGRYLVEEARARTTYPFGFFEKSRRLPFATSHYSAAPLEVEVWPARVELGPVARSLLSRLGEMPTGRKGPGDEFFSLRPFVVGDDPRTVAWRRSARTGRLVARETEAYGAREIVLELTFPKVWNGEGGTPKELSSPGAEVVEQAFAALGSLAEDLLASGAAVGVRTSGVWLPPGAGPRQRAAILRALAIASPHDVMPDDEASPRAARVALSVAGWPVSSGAEHVLELDETGAMREPARAA